MDEFTWTKMYLDLPRRPWLRRMIREHGPAVAWVWVVCCLEAKRADAGGRLVDSGTPLTLADVSDAVSLTSALTEHALSALTEHGWLTLAEDGCYVVTKYEERQNETREERDRRKHCERQARYAQRKAAAEAKSGPSAADVSSDGAADAPLTVADAIEVEEEVEKENNPPNPPTGGESAGFALTTPAEPSRARKPKGAPTKAEQNAADEIRALWVAAGLPDAKGPLPDVTVRKLARHRAAHPDDAWWTREVLRRVGPLRRTDTWAGLNLRRLAGDASQTMGGGPLCEAIAEGMYDRLLPQTGGTGQAAPPVRYYERHPEDRSGPSAPMPKALGDLLGGIGGGGAA